MNWILNIFLIIIIIYFSRKYAITQQAKQLKVQTLLRSALQWHQASNDDNDPILSAIHASKGDAFLLAARTLMSDNDIEVFHPHLRSLITTIENKQRSCILKLQEVLSIKKNKNGL